MNTSTNTLYNKSEKSSSSIVSNSFKKITSKSNLRKAANFLFFGLLLLLVFNPNEKTWMLQQLMAVGLFHVEIKQKSPLSNAPTANLSFNYLDENGHSFSTNDLKDKVVFINFWATWCPPCRAEMPALNKLYNELKDDPRIVFLFINEDEDNAKAKAYLERNAYTMPLQTSTDVIPAELYSGTLPTTIVWNKEGKVVMKHEGLANYNTNKFLAQLKALL
jgi:thiol-disulfide isomerase/thioredoxin